MSLAGAQVRYSPKAVCELRPRTFADQYQHGIVAAQGRRRISSAKSRPGLLDDADGAICQSVWGVSPAKFPLLQRL